MVLVVEMEGGDGVIGFIFNLVLMISIIGYFYGIVTTGIGYKYYTGSDEIKQSLVWYYKNDLLFDMVYMIIMVWITVLDIKCVVVWIPQIIGYIDKKNYLYRKYWIYFVYSLMSYMIWGLVFVYVLEKMGCVNF